MDRARWRSGVLIGLAGLAVIAAAPAGPRLRALRWLSADADRVRALTRAPAECLATPRDARQAYSVALGRAAFRTPLLLGGQAARAGVSCSSCHSNGRRNADFFFPGVSGAPGTADVTDSLFSSHRGDGVFNPRFIPDLGGPRSSLKVSRDVRSRALETFIHGLITQEFDGVEPPPAVLDGVAAYVRAIGPAACPARRWTPSRVSDAMADARAAVGAAITGDRMGDAPAARLMIEAARSGLGDIDERYERPELTGDQRALAAADLDLAATLGVSRAGDPGVGQRLATWLARSVALEAALRRDEPRSFYDPGVLAKALPQPRRPVIGANPAG